MKTKPIKDRVLDLLLSNKGLSKRWTANEIGMKLGYREGVAAQSVSPGLKALHIEGLITRMKIDNKVYYWIKA